LTTLAQSGVCKCHKISMILILKGILLVYRKEKKKKEGQS